MGEPGDARGAQHAAGGGVPAAGAVAVPGHAARAPAARARAAAAAAARAPGERCHTINDLSQLVAIG